MWSWLNGKTTYLTAVAGILTGAVLCVEGHVVEGVQTILASLGLGALRRGVAKINPSRPPLH